MYTVVKVVISACLIGMITELARRFPLYGGILAALPLVSLLSLMWLKLQGQSSVQLQQFLIGVIIGLPATIVLLAGVYIALKNGLHLFLAFGVGLACWGVCLAVQKWVAVLLKI